MSERNETFLLLQAMKSGSIEKAKAYTDSVASGKTDKVASATSGNMAMLDGSGNLADSTFSSVGEDWVFTLTDGSTVTKKMICKTTANTPAVSSAPPRMMAYRQSAEFEEGEYQGEPLPDVGDGIFADSEEPLAGDEDEVPEISEEQETPEEMPEQEAGDGEYSANESENSEYSANESENSEYSANESENSEYSANESAEQDDENPETPDGDTENEDNAEGDEP